MLPHRPTGQARGALRAAGLPLLLLLAVLPTGLNAQSPEGKTLSPASKAQPPAGQARPAALEALHAKAAEASAPRAEAPEPRGAAGKTEAANPAPELDTWMLVGTGALVLLILYTRRRSRSLVTHPAETRA